MSISSEIQALNTSRQNIAAAITQKGGTVSESDGFSQFASEIQNLPSGGSGNPLLTSIDVSDFSGTTFNDCRSYITDVTIPSGVTSIGSYAFQQCTGLTSVTIPSGVTSIGSYAFQQCTGLTSVTIPNNVTAVEQSAFSQCTNLTSVNIGSSLTYLGIQMFSYCTSLTSITIPSNIVTIAGGALIGCTGLTKIIIERTTPPTLQYTNALQDTNNCPIYVPAASVDAYKAANNWSDYASRIEAIPSE